MDAGEKQLREIFEKTTSNNIRSILAYGQETEKLIKKLEKQVRDLDGLTRQYDSKFENMKTQIAVLQTRIFSGGS